MARFIPDETLAPFYEIARNNTMVTVKEEAALAQVLKTGSKSEREAAARRLVLAHVPLVIKIALLFRKSGLPLNELVQEGIVGLYRATRGKFEPAKARFSTYGFSWCKEAILRYVRENKGVVRVPITAYRKRDKINRVLEKHTHDGVIAYGAAGKELKMKPDKIAIFQNLGVESSLNVCIGDSDIEEGDRLEDPNQVEPFAERDESAIFACLNEALAELSPRERRIVMARVGMGEEEDEVATLDKLAIEFTLTRERVRQIQMRALEKLKDSPKAAFLRQYFE